jgi:hypothetical protein
VPAVVTRHSPRVPTVTLGELRLLACPPISVSAMLTLTPGCSPNGSSGSGGIPAAVTDGGGGTDIRRATSRLIWAAS